MSEKPPLTTEAGTPVIDNRHSQTAGPAGADRPRGRHRGGVSEVTSAHVPRWTRMKMFSRVGKRTDLFLRFSTVAGFKGFADTARDPRG